MGLVTVVILMAGVVPVAASASASAAAVAKPTAAPATTVRQSRDRPVRVVRRGGLGDLVGTIDRVDERGIVLDTESMGQRFVTWDAVDRVAPPINDPRFREWTATGIQVWRARTRIDRGDYLLAAPVLETLAPRFIGRSDPMAQIVMEGLLRCRIATGDHEGVMVPMLEASRIRAAGDSIDPWPTLPPVIDADSGFVPAVPPMWAAGADRERIARDLDAYGSRVATVRRAVQFDPQASLAADRAALVARWYRAALSEDPADDRAVAAAARRRMEQIDQAELASTGDGGVAIAAAMQRMVRIMDALGRDAREPVTRPAVTAPDGEPEAAATPDDQPLAELLDPWLAVDRLDAAPTWVRDWTALVRGARAVARDESTRRDLGLIALLGPPARSGVERPYLAGLALALAADGLDASGRRAAAQAVRLDLTARFPGHPSIESIDAAVDISEEPVP